MSDNIPSTQAEINGYTWTIYADTNAETIAQIVRVSKALAKAGYTAPKKWSGGFGGKPQAKPLTQPLIADDGSPCCTVHTSRNGSPLPIRFWEGKDGRPGFWGCMSKAQGVAGESINDRGYCSLRFDWPAPKPETNGRH
jgi:hypothetical protein